MNTITKRLTACGITGVAASALIVCGFVAPAQAAETGTVSPSGSDSSSLANTVDFGLLNDALRGIDANGSGLNGSGANGTSTVALGGGVLNAPLVSGPVVSGNSVGNGASIGNGTSVPVASGNDVPVASGNDTNVTAPVTAPLTTDTTAPVTAPVTAPAGNGTSASVDDIGASVSDIVDGALTGSGSTGAQNGTGIDLGGILGR